MSTYEYGDFCPVAKGAQILCERWTLLILREMLAGCTRFTDFQRYLPRISPSLLMTRLRQLEEHGVVVRKRLPGQRGHEYQLTAAGRELMPVIEAIGAWALRWIYDGMSDEELNVDVLMRDIHNDIVVDKLPGGRTVLQFQLTDQPSPNQWYLLFEGGRRELCDEKRELDVDVWFTSDTRTLSEVWIGDLPLDAARESGRLKIVGPTPYLRTLKSWIGLSPFAPLPRRARDEDRGAC